MLKMLEGPEITGQARVEARLPFGERAASRAHRTIRRTRDVH
jgi:hypothetical protein